MLNFTWLCEYDVNFTLILKSYRAFILFDPHISLNFTRLCNISIKIWPYLWGNTYNHIKISPVFHFQPIILA